MGKYKGHCLAVLGTVSIQQYIFRSNRLKENIGASYLVKHWLEKRLLEEIGQAGIPVDTAAWGAALKEAGATVDVPEAGGPSNGDGRCEVIYIGGGNAALLFITLGTARQAMSAWSRRLLVAAPGLRVAVGLAEVGEETLATAYDRAMGELAVCENALPWGAPLLALPVVRTCATTGLPAAEIGEEDAGYISLESWRKRDQVGSEKNQGAAQQALLAEFGDILPEGQRFALKLEELGGESGEAHIGVVHADGNGMGGLLTAVVGSGDADDPLFLRNVRAFSASVRAAAANAFRKTLEQFKTALESWQRDPSFRRLAFNEKVFPVRPIVYGGDDLTFVCDGRVGLSLAAVYLEEFARQCIDVKGELHGVDACAGVTIVATKFPIARAYGFSEELCARAKQTRKKESFPSGSWLDFQIIPTGITSSIKDLRARGYRTVEGARLDLRPYRVTGAGERSDPRWEEFTEILHGLKGWPRNRTKGLLQALAQDRTTSQRYISQACFRGYALPKNTSGASTATGWSGGKIEPCFTPYFDPLEALDYYLDMKDRADTSSEAQGADLERSAS